MHAAHDPDIWPTAFEVAADKRSLAVTFDNLEHFDLSAEYLRVSSPSAEVQGHSAAERKTVPGKQNVAIRDVQMVGNYAVRIVFDDGHDSGLFTWPYLADLGREQSTLWAIYIKELREKSLTR